MQRSSLLIFCAALLGPAATAQESPRPQRVHNPNLSPAVSAERGTALQSKAQGSVRGPAQYVPTTTRRANTEPTNPAMPALSVDHTRLYWDTTRDGVHWVRGADYKASFGPDGFQFIPFLGPDAPKNFPLRLRLESVQGGDRSWNLQAPSQVVRQQTRLVMDHGPVIERYDVTLTSIEQTFDLGEVHGASSITVRLAVDTELVPSRVGSAWRFSNKWGGVDYGTATVLDGAGHSKQLAVQWMEGGLQVEIPGSFLEQAQGPVILDPLLTTFTVEDVAGGKFDHPDLAYSFPTDSYCAVYEEVFSGGDTDIYSRMIDGLTGNSNALDMYIDFSDEEWTRPSVAYQLDSDVFMVVANAIDVGGSQFNVRARIRNAGSAIVTPVFDIQNATVSSQAHSPDVGGDTFASPSSYFAVVWESDFGTDSDVWIAAYASDGTVQQSPISLSTSLDFDLTEPHISKSTATLGGGNNFNVAWASTPLTASGIDTLMAQQVNYNLTVIGTPFEAAPPASNNYFDLDVSDPVTTLHPTTGEPYFIITYSNNATGIDHLGLALCAGDQALANIVLPKSEHANNVLDRDHPVVCATDTTWIVQYAQRDSASTLVQWELRCVVLSPVGDSVGLVEHGFGIGSYDRSSHKFDSSAIASTNSGGAPSGYFDAMVLTANEVGAFSDIRGALVYSSFHSVSGYQYCYGQQNSTGNRALILAHGDSSTTGTKTIEVMDVPQNQFGYLLAGSAPVHIVNVGGSDGDLCVGGDLGRYNLGSEIGFSGTAGTFSFTVDPTQIRGSSGSTAAVAGQTWYFQTWFRDNPAGSGHSNFTNAVAIPF